MKIWECPIYLRKKVIEIGICDKIFRNIEDRWGA